MMYGIENAAGYDGFGLARYQRFAGDMKTWGEVGDAERALRGPGREFDLLNVRYLLLRPFPVASAGDPAAGLSRSATSAKLPEVGPLTFPEAITSFGAQRFAAEELKLPSLSAGRTSLVYSSTGRGRYDRADHKPFMVCGFAGFNAGSSSHASHKRRTQV